MLTLYHAPMTRSSRIVTLLDELGADARIETVTIPRMDGSGGRDPGNPHPDGKVPLLVHDGETIWESPAIVLYLTDLFPEAGLAPRVGEPGRGTYLSWLAWYGDVMEPVYVLNAAGVEHPILSRTFRGKAEVEARLSAALKDRPYLLGERYSAADLLVQSPYAWFRDETPDIPHVRDWVARCQDRPSVARTTARDAEAMAA